MSLLQTINATEKFVSSFYQLNADEKYIYHNIYHTQRVVRATNEIARAEGIDKHQTDLLTIAAWFHDVGYLFDFDTHEETSIEVLNRFLKDSNIKLPENDVDFISASIIATKYDRIPENIFEQVIADADLHGLGVKEHFEYANNLKLELEVLRNKFFTDIEWVRFEIDFLSNHSFHTNYAKKTFDPLKQKHISLRKEELEKLIKIA